MLSDLWMPCVVFILLTASFITGILKLVSAASVSNTLMISLVWVVYNMIPQYLLIHYTWVGRGGTLQVSFSCAYTACRWCRAQDTQNSIILPCFQALQCTLHCHFRNVQVAELDRSEPAVWRWCSLLVGWLSC